MDTTQRVEQGVTIATAWATFALAIYFYSCPNLRLTFAFDAFPSVIGAAMATTQFTWVSGAIATAATALLIYGLLRVPVC